MIMDSNNLSTTLSGNDSDVDITDDSSGWMEALLLYLTFSDIMNITGNIIIMILIYRECKMKTTPSKLLVNQAVADGMIGLTFFIVTFVRMSLKDDEKVVITIQRVILTTFQSESLQTLAATIFCLYGAICHPIKFRIWNKTWIVAVFIVVSWIINVGVGCLFFAADDTFLNGDDVFFSFYRHDPEDIWYEVLKMIVMFLAPLLGVVCFVKVMIYKRATRQDDVQSQSNTNPLVRQSLGVMFMSTVYVIALAVQMVGENVIPAIKGDYTDSNLIILQAVVYHYLVLKLPLFLLLFKPYRKRAKRMICPCLSRNEISPQENGIPSSHTTRSTSVDTAEMAPKEVHLLHPKWNPALASTSRDFTGSNTSMQDGDLSVTKQIRFQPMRCNTSTNLPDLR